MKAEHHGNERGVTLIARLDERVMRALARRKRVVRTPGPQRSVGQSVEVLRKAKPSKQVRDREGRDLRDLRVAKGD